MGSAEEQQLICRLPYLYDKQTHFLKLFNQHIGTWGLKLILTYEFKNANFDFDVSQLQFLYLTNNEICWEGMKYFATVHWHHLKQLSLYKNAIGDRGVRELIKCNLPLLEILTLSENNLTDVSSRALTKLVSPCLKQIYLSYNRLTSASVENLRLLNCRNMTKIVMNDNEGVHQTAYALAAGAAGLGKLQTITIGNHRLKNPSLFGDNLGWEHGCISFMEITI